MNSNIFRSMSYGVYAVAAYDGDRPTGCIANSTMQITSQPATIAVSMNHNNYTNHCIEKSGKFSISILSEKSDASLIGTFGFQSGCDVNKFDGISYEVVEEVPVIKDSCGYIVCKVIQKMETITHTVFLGEVIEAEEYKDAAPAMTYAYYHQVVKGKSPKNAPTYLPEKLDEKKEEKSSHQYVCEICGYVYEGDELPIDFICPICGQGKDKFKKVAE